MNAVAAALAPTMLGRVPALSLVLVTACASAPRPATATGAAARRPLTLTYLGVAGWQLEADGHTILTDPYFSRPDLDHPIASDPAAVAARSPARADLVLVGHTHVDHALDAAAVAARTGADVVGSPSTAMLARAGGLPDDRIITVKGGEDLAFDGFSVRAIPSLHSALDDKHAFGGSFTATPTLPMPWDAFAEGGTFAYLVRLGGHEVLVLDTANFIERELDGLRPDVAIIAPGLRQEIHDYTCRLLHALGDPPHVFVTHFDDWRSAPADVAPDDDLRAFVAEVQACAPGTDVVIPRHFAPTLVR